MCCSATVHVILTAAEKGSLGDEAIGGEIAVCRALVSHIDATGYLPTALTVDGVTFGPGSLLKGLAGLFLASTQAARPEEMTLESGAEEPAVAAQLEAALYEHVPEWVIHRPDLRMDQYDLRWQGKDAWPLVWARLSKERQGPQKPGQQSRQFLEMGADIESFEADDNPFSWSLFDAYGAYPAVNDRHVTEFFPERFPQGCYYGKTLGVDAFSFEDTIAEGDRIYASMQAQALGEGPLDERIFEPTMGQLHL